MVCLYSCKPANLIFINHCCKLWWFYCYLKYYVIGGKVLCRCSRMILYETVVTLTSFECRHTLALY